MSRLWLLVFLALIPTPSFALSSSWVRDDVVSLRLISDTDAIGPAASLTLGLEIDLANDWHTYWRSPGEAGLPPQLDWTKSQTDDANLSTATLLYPAPHRYSALGLETIGYRDHVIFPIDVVLRQPNKSFQADLGIDLLVCSSVCLPKHFDLSLSVPTGKSNVSAEASLIRDARERVPTDPETAGLLLRGLKNEGQSLVFSFASRESFKQPDIFIEDDQNIGFGAPLVSIAAGGHEAQLAVKLLDTLPEGKTLANMPLTMTVIDGERAAEIKTVTPSSVDAAREAPPRQLSVWWAVLFALVGGLILNLMPCVLPVLSLKILSIVSHGGGKTRRVRQSFLFTATGIIFSFLVLAGLTIILKQFGMALGWGVQFQQPLFLMVLVLLLTFFAANLWDIFDIPLPRVLADNLDSSYHPKLAGDFATGAFATLLATPCSAPFLGTAVGFALASGVTQILLIFASLGFGMALPYLSIALFPRIATVLPKPGAWMIHLRHILGVALALTALWLVWVLAAQISVMYAATFGLFMAAIIILLILKKRGVKKGLIAFGIVEIALVALVLGLTGAMEPKAEPEMNRQWLAFNQNALDANIAEGRTVFLDVTADWCLTCKANMRFSLNNNEVAERLFQSDIVAMQANWTNPDPIVTDLLHKYGRYGIPFNIVFGPGAPKGIVLPELLTPSIVLKALDEAAQVTH